MTSPIFSQTFSSLYVLIMFMHKWQIVDYIASNGACTIKDIIDDDKTRAAQLIKAFGGKNNADEALTSLSKFLLYKKIV